MSYKQECPTVLSPKKRILIIAPEAHFRALGALTTAYQKVGIEVEHLPYAEQIPTEEEWIAAANAADALLLVAPSRRAPRTLLRGPVVQRADGRNISHRFVDSQTAGRIGALCRGSRHRAVAGKGNSPPLALLAQRHRRYKRLSDRIDDLLKNKQKDFPVFNWTSDVVIREEMLEGLGAGLGTAIYLGHWPADGLVGLCRFADASF